MSPEKRTSHRVRQSRNSTQTTLPWAASTRDANLICSYMWFDLFDDDSVMDSWETKEPAMTLRWRRIMGSDVSRFGYDFLTPSKTTLPPPLARLILVRIFYYLGLGPRSTFTSLKSPGIDAFFERSIQDRRPQKDPKIRSYTTLASFNEHVYPMQHPFP